MIYEESVPDMFPYHEYILTVYNQFGEETTKKVTNVEEEIRKLLEYVTTYSDVSFIVNGRVFDLHLIVGRFQLVETRGNEAITTFFGKTSFNSVMKRMVF